MDTELKEYTVTELAGHFVAGQRSPGQGRKILLTPEQAHFAVSAGQLIDPDEAVPAATTDTPAEPEAPAPAEAETPAPKRKGKAATATED